MSSATNPVITRELPPLSLRAAFVPSTVNVEKRTVDVVWSTGERVLRGFYDKFYEELSLDARHVRLGRFNNGAPFCDGHPLKYGDARAATVRGVIVAGTAKTSSKQGTATVRFAKADIDPDAEMLFRKVQDGIVLNVSVGYRIYKLEKAEESIDKVPVYRAIDWEPIELSAVSAGDDDGAGFRSADRSPNPCEFLARAAAVIPVADADLGLRLRLLALARP